jgi:pimeloyl-ACP methyl ester carboxylesterase
MTVLFVTAPPAPRVPRWFRVIVASILLWPAAYTLGVGFLWYNESQLVYNTRNSRDFDAANPEVFHAGVLRTSDGLTLKRVTLIHEDSTDRYWILFCMPAGGSTNLRHLQNQLWRLWTFGYNVLAFDYRGFGRNPGRPTEDGLYLDARAAYASLTQELGVRPDRVILAGRSLGSAVAIDLATRVPAAGLVVFSPIDSVPATGERLYPWAPVRRLSSTEFDNVSKAPRITTPVVFVYGTGDGLVPLRVARALFNEFPGPKAMLETIGGHHFSGFEKFAELFWALDRFWPVGPKRQGPNASVRRSP